MKLENKSGDINQKTPFRFLLRGVILIKEMEFDMIIDENSKPREKLKAWYLFTDDFIAGTSI